MYTSTFLGINTALRGLLSHQVALDTTSHNISNINTEGYSRQRAELTATTPLAMPAFNATYPGQLGTGVEVSSLERMRDQYIDRTIRQQFGSTGFNQTMAGSLHQIERAFNEPSDHALASAIRKMFGALDDVASHPDDLAARATFAQATDNLAGRFRDLNTQLGNISTESDARLNNTVTDVNNITSRIATLNDNIRDATQMGLQPNDLLDERDKLMDDLSQQLNYTYTTNAATNEVTITFGVTVPINLVDPTLPGGVTAIVRADLDTAYGNGDLTSGQAFADEDLFNTQIPAWVTRLDDLVNSLVTEFNNQNAAGFDLNGNAGGNIFDAAGLTAGTMQLDPANSILGDPRLIAAATSWNAPGEPGNGGNAILMADMRAIVQGAPISDTWEGYYSGIVALLGTQVAVNDQDLQNSENVQNAMEARRQETSGVSMDEEMTNMLRFQHAYNASARILTTMDDALDTIINRMGRVGL